MESLVHQRMLRWIFFVLMLSWPSVVQRNRVPRKSQATVARTEHTWAVFGSIVSLGKVPWWVLALQWGRYSRNGPLSPGLKELQTLGSDIPGLKLTFHNNSQNKRKQCRICTSQLPHQKKWGEGSSFATLLRIRSVDTFTLQRKRWWIQKSIGMSDAPISGSCHLRVREPLHLKENKHKWPQRPPRREAEQRWGSPLSFISLMKHQVICAPFQDFKQFLKRSAGSPPPLWGSSWCQQLHVALSASHNNQVREAKSFSLQVGILFKLTVHLVQIRNKSWLC